jgi:hypothetical protein
MLKKNARFFKSLFFISGLFIISLAWILSYVLRFEAEFIRPPILGIPPFSTQEYRPFQPTFTILFPS